MKLNELYNLLVGRKDADPGTSYTASLYQAGIKKIVQKIGEEGTEVVIAGLAQDDQRLIEEIADLTYHTLTLMAQRGITPDQVMAELERRNQPQQK
ncbi:MAG TPA: phosphoribosyl-ATP diphosphatase [Anaerolineales bacterium]|nr:phosphoribosyl-ATP diphosphatase [Anaerolineales bacterium]